MHLKRLFSATCASVLMSAAAQAATQGGAGTTSTGTLGVSMDILEEVKVSNLVDISLGQYVPGGGNVIGTSPSCVFYNNATQYDISASSANSAGPGFQMNLGAENIPYGLEYRNDTIGAGAYSAMNETVVYTVNTATNVDDDCISAGGDTSTNLLITNRSNASYERFFNG